MLAQAVESEVADFLAKHADLKTEDGRQRIVRHGHLPEREVMTGIGPVAVRQPRVRDRDAAVNDPGRIRFTPAILPPYMRRSKSIETLLPIYLKGISTGDFSEALAALLGKDAARLSQTAIERANANAHVIEVSLAHSIGTEVEQAYRRTDLLDRRRRLLDQWGTYCTSLPPVNAGKDTETVVPIRAAL
jgi:hypothetical protein